MIIVIPTKSHSSSFKAKERCIHLYLTKKENMFDLNHTSKQASGVFISKVPGLWKHFNLIALIGLFILGSWQGNAFADDSCSTSASKQKPGTAVKHLYVSRLPLDKVGWSDSDKIEDGKEIRWFCEIRSSPEFNSAPAGQVLPYTFTRELWTKDDVIEVTYVYQSMVNDEKSEYVCKADLQILFAEAARSTVFISQLGKIVSHIKAKNFTAANLICQASQQFTLTKERANLTITLEAGGHQLAGGSSGETKYSHSKKVIITGPEEHFFLTGDVLTSKLSQLKFDKATNQITEQSKPNQAFLSVNYMLGDIFGNSPKLSVDRIVFKFMLNASSKPLDSVGIGIGYQFHALTGDEKQPGALGVFAGYFKTKGTGGAGDNSAVKVGVSYSLDTLLGWK
jgi:hypothetical protein